MAPFAHPRTVRFRFSRATTALRIDEYAPATPDDSLYMFIFSYVWRLSSIVTKVRSNVEGVMQ